MSTIAIFAASTHLAGSFEEITGTGEPGTQIARAEVRAGWFATRIKTFSPQGKWLGTYYRVHRSLTLWVVSAVVWGIWKASHP